MKSRDESGSAVIEFTMLTLVLIVPLFYIVVAVFQVQKASFGVTAASLAATRAFVQAPDLETAERVWRHAAEVTLSDHGVEGAQLSRRCEPQCFVSGSSVEVTVVVKQPLPLAPVILGETLSSITVESRHREPFGKYRANAN
ncbi:MAG: hypothetical protein GX678_01930 [Actinomycetales bacterium]|nr:hypothetical protein [Actinomycetales bacterium]